MRELALTCRPVVSRQPYNTLVLSRQPYSHTLLIELYERIAMFRNLPLASAGSQLFQLIVAIYIVGGQA